MNVAFHVDTALTILIYVLHFTFHNRIVPLGFLSLEILVAFPGESQLRQSRATQPTVRTGYFSVDIIQRNLTWTTGSLVAEALTSPVDVTLNLLT